MNCQKDGIHAGSTHFDALWARDALYASWGLIKRKQYDPVLHTLKTLADHQSAHGQIPLRVGQKHMLAKYLGLPAGGGARYDNDKGSAPALDSNLLFIITLARLVRAQRKKILARNYEQHVVRAMAWLATKKRKDGLLEEGHYASWDDALKKKGASIYHNALYYQALKDTGYLLEDRSYLARSQAVAKALDSLWNGKYYVAWTGMTQMDVAGNLLAAFFGVCPKQQEVQILASLARFKKAYTDELPRTNYPAYPKRYESLRMNLIRLGDYQNCKPYWLWIAALELLVRQQHDQNPTDLQKSLKQWIALSGGYFELYEGRGKPLKRLLYTSERDFSWACGILELADI